MHMTSFTRLLGLLGATVLAVFYQSVFAQPYPNKPIEWVIPYPAGGGTDTVARTLAKVMSEDLGQPLIISNRPGAATNIGADYVAKAKNDGYVIMSADTGTLAANPFLYHHLSKSQPMISKSYWRGSRDNQMPCPTPHRGQGHRTIWQASYFERSPMSN